VRVKAHYGAVSSDSRIPAAITITYVNVVIAPDSTLVRRLKPQRTLPALDFVTFSGDEIFPEKNWLVLAQIVRRSQRDAMANRSSKDARFFRSEGPRGSSLTDARLVLITAIAA